MPRQGGGGGVKFRVFLIRPERKKGLT